MALTHMPWSELRGLASVLLNGTPESRRSAALRLLDSEDLLWLPLLAETVRAGDEWHLQGRCLEVLGLIAGTGDQATVESILSALLGSHSDRSSDYQ